MKMKMNAAALQMLVLCLALRSPARAQTQDGKPEGKSVFTVMHDAPVCDKSSTLKQQHKRFALESLACLCINYILYAT